MPGPICHCDHCGAIFESRHINIQNSRHITFAVCSEPCPNCQNQAHIANGTYDVIGEVISIVSAPEFTHDLFKSFYGLVQRAHRENMPTEELAREAERIDPKLRDLVLKAAPLRRTEGLTVLLAICAAALAQCKANINVNLDVNELVRDMTTHSQGLDDTNQPK